MGLFDWFKSAAKDNETVAVEIPHASPSETVEVAGLDFQAAVAAHQKWKSRLQACIDGTSQEVIDPRLVCQDNQCVLGKWINGHGAGEFAGSSTFSQLKVEHAQFHIIASEVLLAVYGGRGTEAKQKLEGIFVQASLRVQKLLANLFLEASKDK
ncbi:MAG: CZB domain-containing protein [Gallionella sp.]|nr:CZB domain-containing protein [Gallionella sp.]